MTKKNGKVRDETVLNYNQLKIYFPNLTPLFQPNRSEQKIFILLHPILERVS